jgi:hypothetical protein
MRMRSCWLAPSIVAIIFFSGAGAANAQNPSATCPFTLASLNGSYSVIANYGAVVALGMWAETFDGNGHLTRSGVLNEPTPGSTTGQRNTVTVSSTGTYTVNCNGTGTLNRTVTRPDGSTVPEVDDFIITNATRGFGVMVATTIVDAQRVPSAIVSGGIFVTHVHSRLLNPRQNPFFPFGGF